MRVRSALGGGRGIVKPEMAWQYCYELDSASLLYHNYRAYMLKPFFQSRINPLATVPDCLMREEPGRHRTLPGGIDQARVLRSQSKRVAAQQQDNPIAGALERTIRLTSSRHTDP